jgi:hypothetical protein
MTDQPRDDDTVIPGNDAEYDAWFRKQVQASIDDPRPSIPDEEVRRIMAEKRAALKMLADL